MEEKLVSVIIPVYNVEKYIKPCIESIINQTYKNLEIILVDDGSTDSSGLICDEYSERDNRIKVIHQKNRGLSGARNSGIEIAKGEFLSFVDSDDFLDLRFFKEMMQKAEKEKSDIALCGVTYCNENGEFISEDIIDKHTVIMGLDQLKLLLCDNKKYSTTAWAKIYRKNLWDQIRYPEGKYHEDVYTTYKVVDKSHRSSIIAKPYYWYRQITGSITHSKFNLKHLDSVEATKERAEYMVENHPYLKKYAFSTVAYSSIKILEKMIQDNISDKVIEQQLKQNVKKNIWYLLQIKTYSISTKLFGICTAFSVSATKRLYKILRR